MDLKEAIARTDLEGAPVTYVEYGVIYRGTFRSVVLQDEKVYFHFVDCESRKKGRNNRGEIRPQPIHQNHVSVYETDSALTFDLSIFGICHVYRKRTYW